MKLFNFFNRSTEIVKNITDDLLLKSILSENSIGTAEARECQLILTGKHL